MPFLATPPAQPPPHSRQGPSFVVQDQPLVCASQPVPSHKPNLAALTCLPLDPSILPARAPLVAHAPDPFWCTSHKHPRRLPCQCLPLLDYMLTCTTCTAVHAGPTLSQVFAWNRAHDSCWLPPLTLHILMHACNRKNGMTIPTGDDGVCKPTRGGSLSYCREHLPGKHKRLLAMLPWGSQPRPALGLTAACRQRGARASGHAGSPGCSSEGSKWDCGQSSMPPAPGIVQAKLMTGAGKMRAGARPAPTSQQLPAGWLACSSAPRRSGRSA